MDTRFGDLRQSGRAAVIGSAATPRPAVPLSEMSIPLIQFTREPSGDWTVVTADGVRHCNFADIEDAFLFARQSCQGAPATLLLIVDGLFLVAQQDYGWTRPLIGKRNSDRHGDVPPQPGPRADATSARRRAPHDPPEGEVTDPIPVGDDDLQAHVDGRLPAERSALVAAYLAAHPDVAARVADYAAQRDMLREALRPRYDEPIPARLRVATLKAAQRRRRQMMLSRSAAAILLLLGGGLSGWYADALSGAAASPMRVLTADAIAAHRTYTVEVRHPVEVRADDTGQLVQWLSSRLDRSVIAPDLAKQGFRLMGGRILPGADGPAAQIMYDDDHGTRLTIYLQPMAVGLTDFRYTESDGVRTFYRAEHGVAFAVSARTDRERLRGLARVAADQLAAGPPRPSPS